MGDQYANCTSISEACPVDATIYGYYPTLSANIFFLAFFGLFTAAQVLQGLRWRTWTYLVALGFGCLGETIGYVGRVMLHYNPWSNNGFEIQICCLIISPAFLAAGIYLTLKHLVISIGPEFSRIQPKFYTWIFIGCDLFSLILQGAGGGLAASANGNSSEQNTGNSLMMAGIVFQVFTLMIFALLSGEYFWNVWQRRAELSPSSLLVRGGLRFRLFLSALVLAYLSIFTRCVYRIAEMAKGWSNPIMQDQTDFIALDGCMCLLAVLALTAFHPGFAFPEMQMHGRNDERDPEKKLHDTEMNVKRGPQMNLQSGSNLSPLSS